MFETFNVPAMYVAIQVRQEAARPRVYATFAIAMRWQLAGVAHRGQQVFWRMATSATLRQLRGGSPCYASHSS